MTQKKTLKLPKLIGHRGVKDLCPENTIESITKAFDLGLTYVEIDVKISKDEVPILLHDDTLDRTTNGKGLAVNYVYDDIKKLDAGKFFYNKNTNIFVPKLEDILNLCIKNRGNLNIELKPNKNYENLNVKKIIEITNKINEVEVFFSSFDLQSIKELNKLLPKSIKSFLIDDFNLYNLDDLIDIANKYQISICGLNIDIISEDIVKKIKKEKILITAYSNSSISYPQINDMFKMGIDSFFVDDPTEIINIV